MACLARCVNRNPRFFTEQTLKRKTFFTDEFGNVVPDDGFDPDEIILGKIEINIRIAENDRRE